MTALPPNVGNILQTQSHQAPFVVLGPGCNGSNFAAAALQQMGVTMGSRFIWTDPDNPGAYEDMELRDLNSSTVNRKRARWQWVLELVEYCDRRGRAGTQWGMSDPRLSDLAAELRSTLPNARYIWVQRPVVDCARDVVAHYDAEPAWAVNLIKRRLAVLNTVFSDVDDLKKKDRILTLDYCTAKDPTLRYQQIWAFVRRTAHRLEPQTNAIQV